MKILNVFAIAICLIIAFTTASTLADDTDTEKNLEITPQTNEFIPDTDFFAPNLEYTSTGFLDKFDFGFRLTYIYIQNLGTKSTLSASPMRLRFFAKNEIFDNFFFFGGLEVVDGKRTLGSVGQLVPNNLVSTDGYYREYDANLPFTADNGYTSDPDGFYWEQDRTNFVIVDHAHFNWLITSWFEVVLGFVDTMNFEISGDGLATNYASRGPEGGFVSPHFIYPLANTGVDKRNNPRNAIFSVILSIEDWFINRSYVTFGEVSMHTAYDNSWGSEFEFRFDMFGQTAHYAGHLYFCDTEQSWTHHISAGGSGQITQPLPISGVFLFAMASVTEKHIVSEMFTPVYSHFAGGFTVAFDGKDPDRSESYFGIGYSWAKPLARYGTTPEQVIETFWRLTIYKKIQITPDMQYIINPNTVDEDGKDWMFIFGFRVHVRF